MSLEAGPRVRVRLDGDAGPLAPRLQGIDLGQKKRCWETVISPWPPMLETNAFWDECAVAFSGTHWYQYDDLSGYDSVFNPDGSYSHSVWVQGHIVRWDYPDFKVKEVAHTLEGKGEFLWEFIGLTYMNGWIYWAEYNELSANRDVAYVKGGPVSSVPFVNPAVLGDYRWDDDPTYDNGDHAEIVNVVGVHESNRLFGIGYTDDPEGSRIRSVLNEYYPDEPGRVTTRFAVSDTVTGYVINEFQLAADGQGCVWFALWPVGGRSGQICFYDTRAETVVKTGYSITDWVGPLYWCGVKEGLMYMDDVQSVHVLDKNLKKRRLGCLDSAAPHFGYAGATWDSEGLVSSPDFSEVAWMHETEGAWEVRRLVKTGYDDIPPGDSFANAGDLTGWAIASNGGLNTTATVEAGELVPAYSRPWSLWWKWTSPGDVEVVVDALPSESFVTLRVYTGTNVNDLVLVAKGDTSEHENTATFEAKLGVTYYFQLLGRAA